MRILLDANLSPRICPRLQDAGHDASHVVEHGLLSVSDEEILKFAASVEAIIVSADSDFAMLLALGGLRTPSLVLLRSTDHLAPHGQTDLLLANLPTVTEYLAAGAVVSLSRAHLRVRPLPLR